MAHLWILSAERQWLPTPLVEDVVAFRNGAVVSAGDAGLPGVILRRIASDQGAWAMLTDDPRVRLNGQRVALGLAVLEDRDEICVAESTAWFSTEALPCVEPFPDATSRGYCPRCKQEIGAGTSAVKCPACGLWHHASDELPCWTYAATCSTCDQTTALDAGFRWTPEDL